MTHTPSMGAPSSRRLHVAKVGIRAKREPRSFTPPQKPRLILK
jgi:hypothetical protein